MTSQTPSVAALSTAVRAADLLATNPRVKLVYLFGSAVDSANPRDVDLAVWAAPPLSFDELIRQRADLITTLTASIDLVSLNDASILLAYEVAERGRCLYAVDGGVETDFVTRARARYWDFRPYRDEQWRLTGERLKERLGGSET